MMSKLSHSERTYLNNGIEDNFRTGGRERLGSREIEIQLNYDPSKVGTSKVMSEGTLIFTSVNASVRKLQSGTNIDKKASAIVIKIHVADGRLAPVESKSLQATIHRYLTVVVSRFDKKQLVITKNECLWDLQISLNICRFNGCILDATSVALISALSAVRLPVLKSMLAADNEVDLELPDPVTLHRLDVSTLPVIVSMYKIGSHAVTDVDMHEEFLSHAKLVTAVDRHANIIHTEKVDGCALNIDSMILLMEIAKQRSGQLFDHLSEAQDLYACVLETATPKPNLYRCFHVHDDEEEEEDDDEDNTPNKSVPADRWPDDSSQVKVKDEV